MNPSLISVALAFLPAVSSAQELLVDQVLPLPRPAVRGGTGTTPVEQVVHVTYDVQLGRVRSTRTSTPHELALTNPPCYDNSEIVVPIDPQYVVANAGEDLLNWGRKLCIGASLLRRLTIAYRSEAVDVSQGGPGAAFSIALYQGTSGWSVLGTEVYRATFTRMPARGAPGSPVVFFTIDFGTQPLRLADGNIGWSYLQLDGDTGPVLVRAPKTRLGTVDAMDIYSPGPATPAAYVGTFNYGGCAGTLFGACANMWIQLDEIENSELASTQAYDGTGVNPSVLSELLPARLGQTWAARVNVSAPSRPPPFTVLFSSSAPAGPIRTQYGELLIDTTRQLASPKLAEGVYTIPIPPDPALVGRLVFLQAAVLPPATSFPYLTNALRVQVGY